MRDMILFLILVSYIYIFIFCVSFYMGFDQKCIYFCIFMEKICIFLTESRMSSLCLLDTWAIFGKTWCLGNNPNYKRRLSWPDTSQQDKIHFNTRTKYTRKPFYFIKIPKSWGLSKGTYTHLHMKQEINFQFT